MAEVKKQGEGQEEKLPAGEGAKSDPNSKDTNVSNSASAEHAKFGERAKLEPAPAPSERPTAAFEQAWDNAQKVAPKAARSGAPDGMLPKRDARPRGVVQAASRAAPPPSPPREPSTEDKDRDKRENTEAPHTARQPLAPTRSAQTPPPLFKLPAPKA